MNFEDEHYVRAYTRDTKTWLRWGWEGQCVFLLVLRKLDKAGVLDDIDDPVEDIALLTGLPGEVVEIGLPKVLKSGALELVGSVLICPRYIEGQTARKSDAARAKESRQRRSNAARASQIVTDRHEIGSDVTSCDDLGHERSPCDEVTKRDARVTNCDDQSQNEAKRSTADQPRHSTQSNAVQSNAGAGDPPSPPKPTNLDEAIRIPLTERAQALKLNPYSAEWIQPQRWPETLRVVGRLHELAGLAPPKLGSYQADSAVRGAVELFAAGVTVEEILAALPQVVSSDWWRQKRRDFGAVTLTVIRRATPQRATDPDPDLAKRQAQDRADIEADRQRTRAKAAAGDTDSVSGTRSARRERGAKNATTVPPSASNGHPKTRSLTKLVEGIG